jgi:ARG/rhodanese/phosphatase superfamily protein
MQTAQEIEQSFAGLKLGSPQVHLNLALFPLIDECKELPGYLLLDDALERNLARVTEVSADGRVPELAFDNDSTERILLVDGDELVGSKQNRVLNLSVLVGSRQKILIPVSCVEQGRWSYHSRDFRSARRSLFAKARAKKMRQVTESLRVNQDRRSNQSEVWADVADKAAFYRVDSDTLAMADVYEESAPRLSEYAAAFRAEPGQRGAVVAVDGKPIGVELFDSAAAFARYLDKLVRSYALDAIETKTGKALAPSAADARRFLESIQAAEAERFPALGEGEDIRLTGNEVSGGALAANGRVVHLAGFAVA